MAIRRLTARPADLAQPADPAQPADSARLVDPALLRGSCGVGFIADIKNRAAHEIVRRGVEILGNLEHRGAVGANPTTGDGAGALLQMPDALLRATADFALPPRGDYAVGVFFLPRDADLAARLCELIEKTAAAENLRALGWRETPVDNSCLNDEVRACEPRIRQFFAARAGVGAGDDFERKLMVVRKRIEHRVQGGDFAAAVGADPAGFYCASFSARTVVYKGMFLAGQLAGFYPDLRDQRCESAFALVHQRFSTNTFPAWSLAHPYRMIAHNGEINTVRGNINNMRARHHSLSSPVFGADLEKIWPLIDEGQSDTACFDNALELLRLAGYPLAQAAAVLIPEAWQGDPRMDPARRAFYRHHATMMEPWDGPAAIAYTDGVCIGATLDRNGLRPARYLITDDDLIVMASETGVLPIEDGKIKKKWRLEPGKMLLVDLARRAIIADGDIKRDLAAARPYRRWVEGAQIPLSSLPAQSANGGAPDEEQTRRRRRAFGYTEEDLKFILRPMVENGEEPIGSMGDDAPQAALSARAKPLFDYFRQEFAQVTNPAIDPIREEMVMALNSYLGERPNLLAPAAPTETAQLELANPILIPSEMRALRGAGECCEGRLITRTLDATFPVADGFSIGGGAAAMARAVDDLCAAALKSVKNGANILIVSDAALSAARAPIPIVLAVSAVHHHLIEAGERTRAGIVAETGAAREVHHFAVLAGFGAEAIYPWLAYQTAAGLRLFKHPDMARDERVGRYRKAVCKGIYKVMSKMGVSTFQSYCGAQIFEAVGLSATLIGRYFPRTISQIGGVGIEEIAADTLFWHRAAFADSGRSELDPGGDYAYRARGEAHLWTPQSIAKLQHAVRAADAQSYGEYADLINRQSERLLTLRGMLDIRSSRPAIPAAEVEPAAAIVRRFSTGAMSFGSISREAHTTLAIAMNRIGGKSNTGEGGEESERFTPRADGDSMRSAIKQVASGRFGVTAEYLANADMMQIKIAQGAKPGEGGQLPGHKVDAAIARVRHSVPGVGLISPPPHHDIYSIEDIAQLIFDLKNVNPRAAVSVKLVSRYGVGTVAAGVAKARADHITIAGHDGGTGASPLSSIKRAGTPWELGLSETNRILVENDLRGRVALQVDGQIKTGRDVFIGALLGADEFGFATAPLVAQGCIMMRKCHLNTCPVGIATQDPALRKKFAGLPEHIVNYFFFVAEEARALLAQAGFRTLDEAIGRADMLAPRPAGGKAKKLDLSAVLQLPDAPASRARRRTRAQDHQLEKALDNELIEKARPALDEKKGVVIASRIRNRDRATGAMLSGEIARRFGHRGLADDTIRIKLKGSAGQSLGAFLAKGVTVELCGDANDYVGKGLCGGIIAAYPPASARADFDNIIVGNTVLYGAVGGACYFRGVAGERFAVRNSGASAVVEGAGDHCCEYMTGGTVVVIGKVGRNFAAGMSGGVGYVLDEDGDFESRCNPAGVALSPLSDAVRAGQHLRRLDADIILDLLRAHAARTKSPKAKAILNDPAAHLPKFVKVMPDEYRRALLELEKAEKAA